MKCPKCGYDDHGTGDMAHVCATTSPDLIRQVEAESVDTPELKQLIRQYAAHFCDWKDASAPKAGAAYSEVIAHINSIITARVAAAYEAGRLAALRAAPAGHLYAGVSMFSDEELDDMYRHHALTEASNAELDFAREVESLVTTRFRAEGGNTKPIETLAASQAAPAKAEGWQLVPIKPTPEMLHALYVTPDFVGSTIIRHSVDKLPDAYRAMLAAAPSTPAKEPT